MSFLDVPAKASALVAHAPLKVAEVTAWDDSTPVFTVFCEATLITPNIVGDAMGSQSGLIFPELSATGIELAVGVVLGWSDKL